MGDDYPDGELPTTDRVHPTPIYETLAILALVWRVREQLDSIRIFTLDLVLAGIERFLVEFIPRSEEVVVGLTQPQLFAPSW